MKTVHEVTIEESLQEVEEPKADSEGTKDNIGQVDVGSGSKGGNGETNAHVNEVGDAQMLSCYGK